MLVRRTRPLLNFVMMAFLVLGGFALGTALMASRAQQQDPVSLAPITVAQTGGALTEGEQTLAGVYELVSPSVVAISVVSRTGAGGGSGFVVDTQGHIVTNYHVVDGASAIEVNFLDGTIVRADITGVDPASDIAVIKVDLSADRLRPVTMGSSNDLVVGQQVVAIGSPFGQRWTMTAGIVSALDRAIDGFTEFRIGGVIQTDAPINPGNSGGPLINLRGEVVGVNSQIYSETRSNAGIGFAVPSDLVARVANQLITTGTVQYSYLGVVGGDLQLRIAEELNLANNVRGVIISEVAPNGPAALAGLRGARLLQDNQIDYSTSDIITAINGEPLLGFDSLISYLAKYTAPGDTITLSIIRDGGKQDVQVALGARPTR
ncbi:MAG: trypsin-like peptidase domain-containing protein [Anaerolineae bacterium]|jgi:2-alkenal reductase|nr:trypsin-like peptidase domain-containing protein [Anaerolineae bacterium]